ncbi:MAG: phage gp6-like head-tail connector protein [Acidobacteriota bacterium]|nr:phage gp6-like head-tail connector protein [Acidobacteriota bacterium]
MNLAKLTDVKAWLSLAESDDDPLLARLITATSADVLGAIGRPDLAPAADYKEIRSGSDNTGRGYYGSIGDASLLTRPNQYLPGSQEMFLAHFPVNSITKLTVDGTEVTASADGIAPGYWFAADLPAEQRNSIRLIGSVFSRFSQVVIEYNAGYAKVPGDIEQAVIDWVAYRYRSRQFIGQSSKHLQTGETVSFQGMLMPASTQAVITRYARERVNV